MIAMNHSKEVGSIVLSCYSACIVVIAKALSFFDFPLGHQEYYWPSLVEQLHSLNVSLFVLSHSINEPGHVGELLRPDYQSFLRVFTRL